MQLHAMNTRAGYLLTSGRGLQGIRGTLHAFPPVTHAGSQLAWGTQSGRVPMQES
jgi:hypothetical protein